MMSGFEGKIINCLLKIYNLVIVRTILRLNKFYNNFFLINNSIGQHKSIYFQFFHPQFIKKINKNKSLILVNPKN